MPENISALIYILILSTGILYSIQSLVNKIKLGSQLNLLKKPWYVITCLGFLVTNYWLFLSIVGIYLKTVMPKNTEQKIALFVFCALIMPSLSVEIPGFIGINHFGRMNWYRFLIFIVLLPEFLSFINSPKFSFSSHHSDKYVLVLFFCLVILDSLRTPSITDAIRVALYRGVDIIVPYYVVSRGLKTKDDIRRVLFSLFVALLIASLLAIFEVLKDWHFYNKAINNLGIMRNEHVRNYKYRAGFLRASGAYGGIPLGCLLGGAFFYTYYLFVKIKDSKLAFVYIFLMTGLLATLSRGPWVAFFISLVVFFILQKKTVYILVQVLVVSIVVSLSPVGDKFISLLPGVGDDTGGTISYRQDLYEASLEVISDNVWFGSGTFLKHAKMQHLRQGEGIIDIVNTYLQVALEYGVFSLGCFLAILILPFFRLYRLSKVKQYSAEERMLCYVLIAVMVQIIITMATVSSLGGGVIIFIMWVLVAVANAYINILTSKSSDIYKQVTVK